MRRFFCLCGHEIYFANTRCVSCDRAIGFDPKSRTLHCGQLKGDYLEAETHNTQERLRFRCCEHRHEPLVCNWLLSPDEQNAQCPACRSTRTIPDQSLAKNPIRWFRLEKSKRRLFYTLLSLGLDVRAHHEIPDGLAFDFLEDRRTNPQSTLEHVLTGHHNGLITLNAAEADEGFLHTMKEAMGENYRTVLGHFRHEIGHYYWMKLIGPDQIEEFRALFGDERADYARSLQAYYDAGPPPDWQEHFISPYASAHPHEDWAESWAHYMHITDTLESAHAYALTDYDATHHCFDLWIAQWGHVVKIMNALNRSMGLADAYPFILSRSVVHKLRFIFKVVTQP